MMYHIAYQILHNAEAAEKIVQTVFLTLAEQAGYYAAPDSTNLRIQLEQMVRTRALEYLPVCR